MAFPLQPQNSNRKLVDNNEEEEENFNYATQLVFSSVLSMSLKSAIELGVFNIIAKAGDGIRLSASEIVKQMPTNNNPDAAVMVDRILMMLASHSVVGCSVVGGGNNNSQRLYSLNPVSKYFATNEDGVSLGPMMLLVQDKIFLDSWSQLKDAILEGGIPFSRAHGMQDFKYLSLDPGLNQIFNNAMYNYSTFVIKKMLEFYKGFEHLKELVDVGGGLGVTLNLITSAYPHIRGINFDLPNVIEHAPFYPEFITIYDAGVQHVTGDMFERVPSGEAILLKWILHDWGDEHCLKLLKNCCKALPENGKIIVVDAIVEVMPETTSAVKTISQLDVLLMVQQDGGKERSQQEFLALATGAGFRGIKFECVVCNFWVMEFYK